LKQYIRQLQRCSLANNQLLWRNSATGENLCLILPYGINLHLAAFKTSYFKLERGMQCCEMTISPVLCLNSEMFLAAFTAIICVHRSCFMRQGYVSCVSRTCGFSRVCKQSRLKLWSSHVWGAKRLICTLRQSQWAKWIIYIPVTQKHATATFSIRLQCRYWFCDLYCFGLSLKLQHAVIVRTERCYIYVSNRISIRHRRKFCSLPVSICPCNWPLCSCRGLSVVLLQE
jgi:hypothetical protein